MAEAKEYSGINRATMDCLKLRFESHGITSFAGDTGTVEQQGVKVSIAYNAAEQRLQVDIIEKPFFIPADVVWTLLDTAVRGCTEN